MSTEIANPEETYNISPEAIEIASKYLVHHDTKETAEALGIAPEKVTYYLRKPDVKRFIDTIFMEQGFMNRGKIQETMDKLFEIKLEEMLERASVQLEREQVTLIAYIVGILEPVIILAMGLMVLLIVLGILLPIFDLNSLVK